MKIEIKHITKEQWLRQLNRLEVYQLIDGDLVDGIVRPDGNYIYWLGSKRYEY
jgi:hypothetical protein